MIDSVWLYVNCIFNGTGSINKSFLEEKAKKSFNSNVPKVARDVFIVYSYLAEDRHQAVLGYASGNYFVWNTHCFDTSHYRFDWRLAALMPALL